jgi:hypothetical protein
MKKCVQRDLRTRREKGSLNTRFRLNRVCHENVTLHHEYARNKLAISSDAHRDSHAMFHAICPQMG